MFDRSGVVQQARTLPDSATSANRATLASGAEPRMRHPFYYDHFLVALIDGNLVYRTMTLHVTAEKNFRVDKLRVYGRANTVAEVNGFKREASALVARVSRQTQAARSSPDARRIAQRPRQRDSSVATSRRSAASRALSATRRVSLPIAPRRSQRRTRRPSGSPPLSDGVRRGER